MVKNNLKKCSLREQGAGSTKALLIRYFVSITYFHWLCNIFFLFIPIFYIFIRWCNGTLILKCNACSIRSLYVIFPQLYRMKLAARFDLEGIKAILRLAVMSIEAYRQRLFGGI